MTPPLVADLHVHYPMHVLAGDREAALHRMAQVRGRDGGINKLQGAVLWLASRVLNYRSWNAGPRVTLEFLHQGGVRVALSVLYQPFDEMDLDEPYGALPESGYFGRLVELIETVEAEVEGSPDAVVVHRAADLDAALAAGQVALVHCVEGGFHLGGTTEAVEESVRALAGRGVAYVTLAHLFWRQVAANAPALPFLPDWLYDTLFPQKDGAGLTDLGRAAVRAMYRERMLIDVSHMRADSLEQTFALLDELDRESGAAPTDHPVVSSHGGFRFGKQAYNHDEETVRRIADRGGVIGLIFAQHQLNDGVRKKTQTLTESLEVITRHIDRIHDLTGSHEHVGIGTDFDGFIKPTMAGFERSADMERLSSALIAHYGDRDAERILAGNALRLLRTALR